MISANEEPPEVPEQVLVVLFKPVPPKTPPQSETPPPASSVPEIPPVSPEPPKPKPEKKVISEPQVPPAAAIILDPEPESVVADEPKPVAAIEPPSESSKEESSAPVESPPVRLPDPPSPESRDEPVKTAARTTKPSPAPVAKSEADARPSYAQRLAERINHHKSYPRRARERGLSGEVRFSVTINGEGELGAFNWLEGHGAFRRSTLQAVQRALPYPPEPGLAPVSVQLRMIYSLQDRR